MSTITTCISWTSLLLISVKKTLNKLLPIHEGTFRRDVGTDALTRFLVPSKMAKFLKSIFHTTDRRKPSHYEHEAEEDRSESPQPASRRQLSISRSGRMKQANKKRHSLTLELYGETIQIDAVENPGPMEYHVHTPSHTAPAVLESNRDNDNAVRFDTADMNDVIDLPDQSTDIAKTIDITLEAKLRTVAIEKSPEEEIDNAFEILDKS